MKKLLCSAVLALIAVPAMAQAPLKLEIVNGLVNLDATGVPARQILAEWARIGGTKVVGSEKITGAPLTLKLENIPERQALDIILRNVAGYMAAPRRAAAEAGASSYDRIVILPTSAAPAPAPTNANARTPNAFGGPERRMPPRPPGMPDPDDDEPNPTEVNTELQDANVFQQPPVFTFPQPQQAPPNTNNVFVPVQQGGFGSFGQPMQPGNPNPAQINLQQAPNGQPQFYNFVPNGAAPPPAQGGFSVIGAPTPGMVQQPAPMPGQPVPVQTRPPGGK
jgi:hypothetical protein